MTTPRSVTIGIVGHVGNGNLGDEAIIAALIDNMRTWLPGCNFVAFTARPNDTSVRHGVTAFPLRRPTNRSLPLSPDGPAQTHESSSGRLRSLARAVPPLFRALKFLLHLAGHLRATLLELPFLARSLRRLSSVSLLIIAGSQQLSDAVGGPWGFPYTVFKWTLLARLRGISVAIVSVGVGPLASPLSRWFVRRTVRMAKYRSYRDDVSRANVRDLGIDRPGEVVGDLAFSLRLGTDILAPQSGTVAINPMPFVWQDYDEQTERVLYERYIGTLVSFIIWLNDRHYQVTLFPTQVRLDPPVIRDIEKRITELRREASGSISAAHVETSGDLAAVLRSARFVVATRFHGAVLGCHANRPVLALAYHPKTHDLMAQMDQAQYALSVQNLRLESLQAAFVDLETRERFVNERVRARLHELRQKLAGQYEGLAGMVVAPRATARAAEPTTSEARIA